MVSMTLPIGALSIRHNAMIEWHQNKVGAWIAWHCCENPM